MIAEVEENRKRRRKVLFDTCWEPIHPLAPASIERPSTILSVVVERRMVDVKQSTGRGILHFPVVQLPTLTGQSLNDLSRSGPQAVKANGK